MLYSTALFNSETKRYRLIFYNGTDLTVVPAVTNGSFIVKCLFRYVDGSILTAQLE